MRILLASDHYPPFIGGAQRQTGLLAQTLHSRGHEVLVATVWHDHLPGHTKDGEVPVVRLRQVRTLPVLRGPARRRDQPPFPDPVTVAGLRRLLRDFRPDVVHAAGWFAFSAAAALIGTDVPLVYSARDYGFACANATLLRRGAPCDGPAPAKCLACAGAFSGGRVGGSRSPAWPAAHRCCAAGSPHFMRSAGGHAQIAERDLFAGVGGPPVGPVVIPSFRVDEPEDVVAAAVLPDIVPDEPFMLFVGALRRVKGVEVLLEAYRRLDAPPPLVLIGTIERDTPRDLPRGVIVVPEVPHAGVLRAWDRSLFGVMPSLWPEPFGSVVHEAMSRGRPVIGTAPGGHEDMITDGVTGLWWAGATLMRWPRQFVACSMTTRNGPPSAHALRERARAFGATEVIPQFEELYRRAVDVGGRPRPTTPRGAVSSGT